MGFDMKVMEETVKFAAAIPGKSYFHRNDNFTPIDTLPEHPTTTPSGEKKPRLIVIDGSGWLNARGAAFEPRKKDEDPHDAANSKRPDRTKHLYGRTLGELRDVHVEKLMWYLKEPSVEGVIFLYDQSTPAAKAVRRNASEHTPKTPFHLVSGTDTPKTDENAFKAWTLFTANNRDVSDGKDLRLSSEGTDLFSCVLPPSKSEIAFSGEQNLAYERYLENKHYKRMLYRKLAQGIADSITVPEGKWICISTRDYCTKKTSTGFVQAESALRHNYKEGDRGACYYATAFADEYDVDIDADDGDVITSCLLTAFTRVIPPDPNFNPKHNPSHNSSQDPNYLENLVFRNSVRILKCQFLKSSRSATIDVNNMYLALMRLAAVIRVQRKIGIGNIIGCWAILAMLSGNNDYVDSTKLPQLAASSLFKNFFANLRLYTDMVSAHTSLDAPITLDPDSLAKFVMSAYGKKNSQFKAVVNYHDIGATFEAFNSIPMKFIQDHPLKVADIRVLAGSLSWSLNYWVSGVRKSASYPNEFQHTAVGPVYGFIRTAEGTDKYGHQVADWSDDADAAELKRMHMSRGKPQTSSPSSYDSPANLEGLRVFK